MENYSLTYTGIIIFVLARVVEMFGWNILPGEIETVVLSLAQVVGVLVTLYGRYRVGDLKVLGTRKPVDK